MSSPKNKRGLVLHKGKIHIRRQKKVKKKQQNDDLNENKDVLHDRVNDEVNENEQQQSDYDNGKSVTSNEESNIVSGVNKVNQRKDAGAEENKNLTLNSYENVNKKEQQNEKIKPGIEKLKKSKGSRDINVDKSSKRKPKRAYNKEISKAKGSQVKSQQYGKNSHVGPRSQFKVQTHTLPPSAGYNVALKDYPFEKPESFEYEENIDYPENAKKKQYGKNAILDNENQSRTKVSNEKKTYNEGYDSEPTNGQVTHNDIYEILDAEGGNGTYHQHDKQVEQEDPQAIKVNQDQTKSSYMEKYPGQSKSYEIARWDVLDPKESLQSPISDGDAIEPITISSVEALEASAQYDNLETTTEDDVVVETKHHELPEGEFV